MTRMINTEFRVKLAETPQELHAAQRLRYDVFVQELGGGGDLVDHETGLEQDRIDPHFDHMILTTREKSEVIGVYRLLRTQAAQKAGGFYSEAEYDLSVLKATNRPMLELGRSCLHRDYRGGMAMHCLWNGLAQYIATHRIELLFGVASFHGTDIAQHAAALSLLHHRHLAPVPLRVRAQPHAFQPMDLIPEHTLDRRAAMVQVPSLIKAYLRLGGCVGEGAYVDHAFNTTDVFMVMDTANLTARQAQLFERQGG